MQTFKNKVIVLAAAGLLAAIVSLMNSHQASAQNPNPGSAPVNIVSSIPLQVTGSTTVSGTVAANQSGAWNVGITGTPTVSATQSGAWNVGIAGTPTFNLQTPSTPVPVSLTTPGKSLVQADLTLMLPTNTVFTGGVLYHNSSGKTLVIELVSLLVNATSIGPANGANASALLQLNTTANGAVGQHFPVQATQMGGVVGVGSGATSLHLYADPNTDVTADVFRADNVGSALYKISMSGYLTDVP